MKIIILPLVVVALFSLSACGSDAVRNFDSYEVGSSSKCVYKDGVVTQTVNIKGSAHGEQTVKVSVDVEDEDGNVAGKTTKSFKVKDKFKESHKVVIKVSKKDWNSGSNNCFLTSEN